MENSAAAGFRLIEFAYLRPERFDLDALARRAQALDLAVTVTMGLPFSADVSSEDGAVVRAGEELLANAVAAVRDIGGTRLGGILYSAHAKYATKPTARGRKQQHRGDRQDRGGREGGRRRSRAGDGQPVRVRTC